MAKTRKRRSARQAVRGRRIRMAPSAREQQIVEGSIKFFAEKGFSGTTRDLAARLGVVHGLIYRYFPTKEELIERVYQEVFERSWKPEWLGILSDRSTPLRERLIRFYLNYAAVITQPEWVRMFVLAGFAGLDIGDRYRASIRRRVFPVVIAETRHALGIGHKLGSPISDAEHDLMYVLHGGLFYIGMRRWVFRAPIRADDKPNIVRLVDIFLAGAKELLRTSDSSHRRESSQQSCPSDESRVVTHAAEAGRNRTRHPG